MSFEARVREGWAAKQGLAASLRDVAQGALLRLGRDSSHTTSFAGAELGRDCKHSFATRGLIRPRALLPNSLPSNQRAQGMPGAPLRPCRVCLNMVDGTRVSQVPPESPGFPAQWFNGCLVLPPAIGLFCHRHAEIASNRLEQPASDVRTHRLHRRSNHRPCSRGRYDSTSPAPPVR